MATVNEVYGFLDKLAPFDLQMDFDNAGFLVGRGETQVKRLLVALDVTLPVAKEAAEKGCQLIVSHHPVIFHPVKALTDQSATGRVLLALAEGRMAAICAHTNLDAVMEGVNCCLARRLELSDLEQLHQDGLDHEGRPYGIGRVGTAHRPGMTAGEYAAFVKEKLGAASVRYADGGKPSAGWRWGAAPAAPCSPTRRARGCDTFVTADVKHDQYIEAKAMGITLMDAGHFATENVVCAPPGRKTGPGFPRDPGGAGRAEPGALWGGVIPKKFLRRKKEKPLAEEKFLWYNAKV